MSISLPKNQTACNGAAVRQPMLFHPVAYGDLCLADPCAGRHRGAETSVQAHERIRPHKRAIHENIIALARARGAAGITVHEAAAELQTYPSSVSGRLTELRILGRLTYALDATGARVKRRGACVLIATEAAAEPVHRIGAYVVAGEPVPENAPHCPACGEVHVLRIGRQ